MSVNHFQDEFFILEFNWECELSLMGLVQNIQVDRSYTVKKNRGSFFNHLFMSLLVRAVQSDISWRLKVAILPTTRCNGGVIGWTMVALVLVD